MPNVLDLIFTPFFVMLITMLVILLGVGPIMHTIELGMVGIIENLIHLPFGIGGFIIGFTYPLAVITGLHHTYVMIETSLLANTGFNPLITLCAMYGFANVGTCLAFFVKAKKQNIKQTSIGAMLSQLFGISEPVLFGIQLRFNLKPLCIMLFSSGIGAALLSIMNIQSNSYGLAVLPSYLMYIYEGHQLIWYFLISLFSTILCFVLTCLFGIPQEVMVEDTIAEENAYFIAPASGTFVPLENVPDETFAKKMLGDGFAIDLQDEFIISPVAGEVVTAFPDGHAFGIKGKDGMEILIHIGINTVDLQESCFTPLVSLKESVKQGQPIVKVDLKKLKESGKSGMTMIIFTNKDKLQIEAANQITAGNKMHLSFS